jgi:hypothetical protein
VSNSGAIFGAGLPQLGLASADKSQGPLASSRLGDVTTYTTRAPAADAAIPGRHGANREGVSPLLLHLSFLAVLTNRFLRRRAKILDVKYMMWRRLHSTERSWLRAQVWLRASRRMEG